VAALTQAHQLAGEKQIPVTVVRPYVIGANCQLDDPFISAKFAQRMFAAL
jgi:hypothetical protein